MTDKFETLKAMLSAFTILTPKFRGNPYFEKLCVDTVQGEINRLAEKSEKSEKSDEPPPAKKPVPKIYKKVVLDTLSDAIDQNGLEYNGKYIYTFDVKEGSIEAKFEEAVEDGN